MTSHPDIRRFARFLVRLREGLRRFLGGSRPSVVIYSPANLNALDGSSVWTKSISLAFAGVDGIDTSLVLSHAITNDRLLRPLVENPALEIVDPFESRTTASSDSLSVAEVPGVLAMLPPRRNRAMVVRGMAVAGRLAADPRFRGQLWAYLTDIPQQAADIDAESRTSIEAIVAASRVILCQTEELKAFFERHFARETPDKCVLLPPIVPDAIEQHIVSAPTPDDIKLCYSGKFAPLWKTLEICDIPSRLADRQLAAEVTMIGEKINRDPEYPEYVQQMRDALEHSSGVNWIGGVSHSRSIELISNAHLGLSWRDPAMDVSLELSTKLLEYCAAGTPPIMNRTPMHERIFGRDYPLFVSSMDEILDAVEMMVQEPHTYDELVDHVARIPESYSASAANQRLTDLVKHVFGNASQLGRRAEGRP